MIFIDACLKKPTPYTPVWMMRQAGRYLPEYMRVRSAAGGFLSLCKDYKKASEVTIQPVEILGVDAAILFSDILVVPLEMGMDLRFEKGEGPVFSNPIKTAEDLDALDVEKAVENLSYVYDTIGLTRQNLSADKALIGFCGAPWTIATYMIEGGGTKTYAVCKKLLYTNPEFLHQISGNFEVLGVDWSTPLKLAKAKLSPRYVLQGNMEPTRLYDKKAIETGVERILQTMKGAPHIFNLGHGILPDVPVENAKYFIKLVQEKSAR